MAINLLVTKLNQLFGIRDRIIKFLKFTIFIIIFIFIYTIKYLHINIKKY